MSANWGRNIRCLVYSCGCPISRRRAHKRCTNCASFGRIERTRLQGGPRLLEGERARMAGDAPGRNSMRHSSSFDGWGTTPPSGTSNPSSIFRSAWFATAAGQTAGWSAVVDILCASTTGSSLFGCFRGSVAVDGIKPNNAPSK